MPPRTLIPMAVGKSTGGCVRAVAVGGPGQGFVGKVLGPIGLAVLIPRGTWPPATLILIVTNDIVWWVPFARYLMARPKVRNRGRAFRPNVSGRADSGRPGS